MCDVFLLHFESFLCILDSSSLSQVVFTILFPLPFYINFRIIHTRKKFNGILNGIGLNLLLTGKNGHFNNIESSFFFLVYLGLHLWHMEVARVRVKSELHLLAYATVSAMPYPSRICDLQHSSRQRQILNPLSETGDKPSTSWFLVRFVSTAPCWELQVFHFSDKVCLSNY